MILRDVDHKHATTLLLALLLAVGLATAPTAAGQEYPVENSTFNVSEGPQVYLGGQVTVNSTDPLFPDNRTVQFGGLGNFTAQSGGAAVEVYNITSNFTEVNVTSLPASVGIDLNGSQRVEIEGDTEYIEFRNMTPDDGNRDFTYGGTNGISVVTVYGLPVNTTVEAVNISDGSVLNSTETNSSGVGTFSLPNSRHEVELQAGCQVLNPVGSSADPPTDTTGDGLCNDLNGDSSFSLGDVIKFYDNYGSEDTINNNKNFFDFNDDKSITLGDVINLYGSV